MGCTHDVINIRLDNKDYLQKFVNFFNDTMSNYLYADYCKIKENFTYREDEHKRYWICLDEEPLFRLAENGAQVDFLVKEYLKKYPEANLYVSYNSIYCNSGEATYIEYSYSPKTKELNIKRIYGDSDAIEYCPECDADFEEPLVYLEDYNNDETYCCPECGEEITMDVEEVNETIKLEDF